MFAKPRTAITSEEILRYASKFTTISNIYRFIGYYVLHSTYLDSFPFAWAKSYLNNRILMCLLSIHPMLFGLSLVIYAGENDKSLKKSFFILALFLALMSMIMKGCAEPFSNLGIFLLKLHEVFFRHPHDRFIHSFIIIYCLVLLFLFRKMSEICKSKHFYACSLVILAIFGLLGYPFFTSNLVHESDKINLTSTDYLYLEDSLRAKIEDLSKYRFLIVPYSLTGTYSYNILSLIHI